MSANRVLLTQQGLKRLEDELHELRTRRRVEVAEAIHEAQELGTAQIDGQYEDAKNQQAFLEGRIREIELLLESAELIDEDAAHHSVDVRVGSNVTVQLKGGVQRTFQLVAPRRIRARAASVTSRRSGRRCSAGSGMTE